MQRQTCTLACVSAMLALAGCASDSTKPNSSSDSEGVVHEYRTGSLIRQKDKRPVTEEERQQAKDTVEAIRSSPQTIIDTKR